MRVQLCCNDGFLCSELVLGVRYRRRPARCFGVANGSRLALDLRDPSVEGSAVEQVKSSGIYSEVGVHSATRNAAIGQNAHGKAREFEQAIVCFAHEMWIESVFALCATNAGITI